jgi:cell division protein FtsQ
LYEDRISVLLGTTNELEYKMQFARYLLLNEEGKGCAATDTGVIDCSHVRTDGTIRPTFAQGKATMPSGYDPSEPKTVIEVTQPTETTTPTEAESEAPSSTETETESAGESEPTTAEGESESEAEAPTESEPAGTEGEGETEEETTEPTEQTAASEAA